MILRSPKYSVTPFAWTKALLLSPGILFLSGYLVLYGAVSCKLNGTFKEQVQQGYQESNKHAETIRIGSVIPTIGLDALTIRSIELISAPGSPENHRRHKTLRNISIEAPELQKTLFCKRRLLESASGACETILKMNRDAQ
ncbi:MAG: hypothetical protein K9I59_01935 [Chlorobium sp.]|jgi:hypothetical protein|nr:hypothetical protein [Chlorobium sp.]MCF8270668.1 hypothetical protein [Chlorobium sp.]MCF8286822.1 hypothetical protein [Chlorobium sp.]